MLIISQYLNVIMLYTWNLHSAICQLYVHKMGRIISYEQTSEEECSEDFLTWIKITHSQKKKKKEKHKNRMVSGGRLGP